MQSQYNTESKKEIARKGGRALVEKYGREYMSRIGRIGFRVTTERHFGGDARAHVRWLISSGLASQDRLSGYDQAGFFYVQSNPPIHPARG